MAQLTGIFGVPHLADGVSLLPISTGSTPAANRTFLPGIFGEPIPMSRPALDIIVNNRLVPVNEQPIPRAFNMEEWLASTPTHVLVEGYLVHVSRLRLLNTDTLALPSAPQKM